MEKIDNPKKTSLLETLFGEGTVEDLVRGIYSDEIEPLLMNPNSKTNELEDELARVLINRLRDNNDHLSSKQIAEEIGIDPGPSYIKIRMLMKSTITKFGLPIASDQKGAFWIHDAVTLLGYIQHLQNKIKGILARISDTIDCFTNYQKMSQESKNMEVI